jgi:fibronectin type 3 domain-containing protein
MGEEKMKKVIVFLSVIFLGSNLLAVIDPDPVFISAFVNNQPGEVGKAEGTPDERNLQVVAKVKVEEGRVTWIQAVGNTLIEDKRAERGEVLLAGPLPEGRDGIGSAQSLLLAPDLVVTSVAVSDATGPGISYQGTIRNQGTATATGTVHNYIYLSLDTSIQPSDHKIDDWVVSGSLPAGASQSSGTLTTTVTGVPGGEYYLGVWVDAENGIAESNDNNNTSYDSSLKVVIPLSAPTGLMASDGSYTSNVGVSWNSVLGASYYNVYRNTVNSTGGAAELYTWQSNTSYDDNGAVPGVTYYYFVKAATSSSGDNASPHSASDDGWRSLSAPTGVTASDGTYTDRVYITWNTVWGASHYRVYRNTENNAGGAVAVLGFWQSGPALADYDVTPGQTYWYWVKAAVDDAGTRASAMGGPDSGYRLLILSAPTGVSATNGVYEDKTRVTWNSVENATHYRVYRNTTNSTVGAAELGTWQSGTIYDDGTATPGVTYYFWVKAAASSSGDNASGFSNYTSGYRHLDEPTGVSASFGIYIDKVHVAWNSVEGASYYRVIRSTENNQGGDLIGALSGWVAGLGYDDTDAVPGVTYWYWVQAAVDGSGSRNSELSLSAMGLRKISAPTGVSASDGTYTDRVRVSWNSVEGASFYHIYRNTSDNSAGAIYQSIVQNALNYDDMNADPGDIYFYWVVAAHMDNWGSMQFSAYSASNSGYAREPLTEQPDIAVNPVSFDFGSVTPGSSSDHTFVIMNNGPADLHISGSSLTGPQASVFSITFGSGSFTMVHGGTQSLTVRFAPNSAGDKSATLRIASDDPDENPFEVSLSGRGQSEALPVLSVAPDTLDFGTADTALSFTVSNTGGGTLNWSLSADPEKPWITAVSPMGGTGEAEVEVTVDRAGLSAVSDTATLDVTSDGGDANVIVMIRKRSGSLPETWVFRGNTGNNATVVLPVSANPNIDGEPLTSGDCIGVFTPGGLCCGWSQWPGENISITLWGDDTQTPETDGFQSGDTICFRIWDTNEETEYMAVPEFEEGPPEVYLVNGFSVLTGLTGTVSTGIGEIAEEAGPAVFALLQNYPNPFNPETTIRYTLSEAGHVALVIYNVSGEAVRTLVEGMESRGRHEVKWDGRDNESNPVSGGIYVCRLRSGADTRRIKMLFLR